MNQQSFRPQQSSSAFDEMFSFESQIESKLPPATLEQIDRERLAGEFGTGKEWLSQPGQPAAYRKLKPVDQLRAAFAGCEGYVGSELEAMVEHMRSEKR